MKIEPSPLTSPPTDDEIAAARTVVRLNRHLAHALAKVDLTEEKAEEKAVEAEKGFGAGFGNFGANFEGFGAKKSE